MKLELKKVEVITILVAFESRITTGKINYTTKPAIAHNIYTVLQKIQKYIVPYIKQKSDKLLIKSLITINIQHLGMIEYGKTKKRKSSN